MEFPAASTSKNVSLFIHGVTIHGNMGIVPQRGSWITHPHKHSILGLIMGFNSFSNGLSTTLPPINVTNDFMPLNAIVGCNGSLGGTSASILANIKSDTLAQVNGVVAMVNL